MNLKDKEFSNGHVYLFLLIFFILGGAVGAIIVAFTDIEDMTYDHTTELYLKVEQLKTERLLDLIGDLIETVEKYEIQVNEILMYRDGELENRIKFRHEKEEIE